MPLEKIINTNAGVIGIWNLNDSVEELMEQCTLSISDQKKINTLKLDRRKKELLATRILLEKLLGKNQEISYNDTGMPFLKGSSKNISISHSADFATIFISENNIGIDVEQTTRQIDKLLTRYLHPEEQEFIEGIENQQFAKILFWSAKEAIYKCSKSQAIHFNKQIYIPPFKLIRTEGECNGSLLLKEKKKIFKLHYCLLKNNVLVYCVQQ